MKSMTDFTKKFAQVGAILTNDHFIYTSGKHGSAYVNKDAIYPHTELTHDLTKAMVEPFANQAIDVVAAPVIGGVILSQWMAYHLSQMQHREILCSYAEKRAEPKGFEFKRGYDKLVSGKNVLVAEDILNTGGSIKLLIEELHRLNANIVGISAICNRGNVLSKDLGTSAPLFSLMDVKLEAFDPSDCPLCKKNIQINTTVGKGNTLTK